MIPARNLSGRGTVPNNLHNFLFPPICLCTHILGHLHNTLRGQLCFPHTPSPLPTVLTLKTEFLFPLQLWSFSDYPTIYGESPITPARVTVSLIVFPSTNTINHPPWINVVWLSDCPQDTPGECGFEDNGSASPCGGTWPGGRKGVHLLSLGELRTITKQARSTKYQHLLGAP